MVQKRNRNLKGTVRIIGGVWRGRKLPVPELPGLRPSGDRGREILFNWLQAGIRGSRCVDLFAGTGVLGLEAASRGAAQVVLIETSRTAAASIRESLALLGADKVKLVESDALGWLSSAEPASLDIVFIDPPFGQGLERRALKLLDERDCVAAGGLVYVETSQDDLLPPPRSGWEINKDKTVGDVRLLLLKKI